MLRRHCELSDGCLDIGGVDDVKEASCISALRTQRPLLLADVASDSSAFNADAWAHGRILRPTAYMVYEELVTNRSALRNLMQVITQSLARTESLYRREGNCRSSLRTMHIPSLVTHRRHYSHQCDDSDRLRACHTSS